MRNIYKRLVHSKRKNRCKYKTELLTEKHPSQQSFQFAQLSDDIYSINWDEASGCFRRKLAFAMSRCQKPMRITIGKFADADISSAISVRYIRETILPLRLSGINFQVVKMAYSFRTLLSNIKMKN